MRPAFGPVRVDGAVESGAGFVAEDDVVDADAGVEAALLVEVERLVDRDWRDAFVDVVERAVVAQSVSTWSGRRKKRRTPSR